MAFSGNGALPSRLHVPPWVVSVLAAGVGAVLAFGLGYKGIGGLETFAVVGGLGLLLVYRFPRPVAMLLVVLALTAFKPPLNPMSVAGIETDVPELMTYALIGAWLVAVAAGAIRRNNALTAPVVLLVFAAVVGAAYGLLNDADQYALKGALKSYLTYLVALPLAAYFATTELQRRLEQWLLTVATVASGYVLFLVGTGRPVASDAHDVPLNTLGTISEAQRVRPSLIALLLLTSLLLLARVLVDGWTAVRAVQAVLFTMVWLFSFNRANWLAFLIAAAFLLRFRPGERRPLRGLRVLVAALLLLPPTVAVASTGSLGPSAKALVLRAGSLVNPNVTREHSFTDRADEDRDAVRAIAKSPIFGVGIGRLYGAQRRIYSPRLDREVLEDRPYVHNSLLQAYLQLGLLGMAAFALLGWRIARTLAGTVRRLPPRDGARLCAAGYAVLGFFVLSLLQPNLLHRPSILALCLALALAVPPEPDEAADDAAAAPAPAVS